MADDPLILGKRDLLGFYFDTLLAGAHDCWGFVPSGSTLSDSGPDGSGSSGKVPGGTYRPDKMGPPNLGAVGVSYVQRAVFCVSAAPHFQG